MLLLSVLHLAAYLAIVVLHSNPQSAPALDAFSQSAAGLVLHGFLTINPLLLLTVIAGLWLIGGRVEEQFGAGFVIGVYAVAMCLAVIAYTLAASIAPAFARLPLDFPAGPLAAFALTAWVHGGHEFVPIFGRPVSFRTVLGWSAGIVAALILLGTGAGAIAWLSAVVAGALASPLCEAGLIWIGNARQQFRARRPRGPLTERERRRQNTDAAPKLHRNEDPDLDIDDVLTKISHHGVASLSDDDRARLERARQAKLHGS